MDRPTFRTELQIPGSPVKIGLKDVVVTMGSCFSDVIGGYLQSHKFDATANPFGTVYNPISIFNLLSPKVWEEDKFVESNGAFYHYDAHSSFLATSKDELASSLQRVKGEVDEKLQKANWLVITFGTSLVYKMKSTNDIVANCHKVPQKHFSKHALSMKELTEGFDSFYQAIKRSNPSLKLLLTVSPVRHIKDGLVDNSSSKAKLRVLCDMCSDAYDGVYYFPSYEIMLDDLRDYRFYKADMIHPNDVAEEYIWDKFQQVYFDQDTQNFVRQWEKIKLAINHKPFNRESYAHQRFLISTLASLEKFKGIVDISEEEKNLKDQMI